MLTNTLDAMTCFKACFKYTTKLGSLLYKDLLDSCSHVLDKILVKFDFSDFVILQTQNF